MIGHDVILSRLILGHYALEGEILNKQIELVKLTFRIRVCFFLL